MQRGERLLIFGASARAAAFSALRAGLAPWCVDLFADADLRGRCARPCACRASTPTASWRSSATACRGRGCTPAAWRTTRCWCWSWPRAGRCGATTARPAPLPPPRLPARRRPRLRPAGPRPRPARPRRRESALPAQAAPQRGRTRHRLLVGRSGQRLLGRSRICRSTSRARPPRRCIVAAGGTARAAGSDAAAGRRGVAATRRPFAYCGSVGPLPLDCLLAPALRRLGHRLAAEGGLRGLFGIDGVLRDGAFWPVEVNPRYTASVEVLEYATGLRACTCTGWRSRTRRRRWTAPVPDGGGRRRRQGDPVRPRATSTSPPTGPWSETLPLLARWRRCRPSPTCPTPATTSSRAGPC